MRDVSSSGRYGRSCLPRPFHHWHWNERVENEFLDQAITAFLSGSYHVRNAAMTAIRRFMQQNEENSFQVCRRVEGMDNSSSDVEQLLYNLVKEEVC